MNNCDNSSTIQLPAGTKEYWTKLMAGSKPIQGNVDLGTPAMQAYTAYDDGTQVIIGVTYDYMNNFVVVCLAGLLIVRVMLILVIL